MKFLVFQHVEHETPGLILDSAKSRNVDIEIVELWKPYKIPNSDGYNALVIMGGPMGVYEDYASKNDEVKFIKDNLGKLPMIGFCLGSQLLAYALGAKVYKNEVDGKVVKEIGYYDVSLTEAGQNSTILKGFNNPTKVLQWHGDTFDLPEGAELLATAPLCKNQAFAYGKNCFAFQYHVEFTPEMVNKLIEIDKDWINKDFSFNEQEVLQKTEEYKNLMVEQCNKLMDNFTKTI